MSNYKTNKWSVISPNVIGDFNNKPNGPFYGCIITSKKSDNDSLYHFGRFNKNTMRDGLIATAYESSIHFANYRAGILKGPDIVVDKNGKITIVFSESKENKPTKLELAFEDSGFTYGPINENGVYDGTAIFFHCVTGKISYQKYQDGKVIMSAVLPKTFKIRNPFESNAKPVYPKAVDISKFQFSETSYQTFVYNSSKDDTGIGVMTVEENLYSVGMFKGQERDGFQIAYFDDYYGLIYGHGNTYSGPVVEVRNDGVFIMTNNVDKDGKEKHSAILTIVDNYLYLSDCVNGTIEVGDPTLRIIDCNEVSFDKKGDNTYTDYFYGDKLLVQTIKEEPKQPEMKLDPNDPEYKMMSLIGQEDAKKEFKRIRAYIQKNDASKIYKNIVFSGENGVGKSTVGKLISEVLYKYHAISYKTYVEKSAKEIYNNFTGGTAENLESLVKLGRGGVILIDDLHYLDALNSSNVNEGLFALAKVMDENPQTVFILCDNKYNINQILQNNIALFQRLVRFHVNFTDFTRDELTQILMIKLNEKGYTIEPEAMDKLLDIIFLSKTYGNNINATAAISILEEIIVIQNVRTELVDDKTITKDDIDVYVIENDIAFIDQKTGFQSDARKKLDELIGLEKIKETVDDLIAYFSINRGKKVDFHMCFSGNPGTGKTEVARIIGKLLRQEGILPTSKFLEVTRKDLIGQYIGQTAILTRDIIDKAMGGVLYIDEAYSLAYGTDKDGSGKDYGQECVAELLKAMEDRRGEFCVILAGYTSEMAKLFALNPGFKSRIKFDLEFPDYSDEELEKIARLFLKRDNLTMSDENLKFMVKIVSIQRNYPNFANVRTLREAISKIQIKHARKYKTNPDDPNINELTYDDIVGAFSTEEVERVLEDNKEEVKIPKANPEHFKELYKDYQAAPFSETQDYLSEAVLALRMSDGKSGEGTGFMISKDGYFLTCAHCVDGAGSIVARRRISHHGRYIDLNYNAYVVSMDKRFDVALCKVEADEKEEFEYLTLADGAKQPEKLSKVYLLGYPFGVSRFDEMSINEGKVMSYQKETPWSVDQINLDIQAKGGNSGSPVIDAETSKVIGVFCGSAISHGQSVTEEINYCRPIKYVWNMLEKEYKENN